MDKQLIEEKLESLRRSISRVSSKYNESKDSLLSDFDAQDVITLNLTRAVQLCVEIAAHIISQSSEAIHPATMAESFLRLNELGIVDQDIANMMIKAVGFRNIAVHNYQEIDWNIVKSICAHQLNDFKRYAKIIDALV